MRISRSLKFQNEQFGSAGVEISVDHTELGLADPTTVEQAYECYKLLGYHVEALMLLEEVKLGRIHPSQVTEKLKPWAGASD